MGATLTAGALAPRLYADLVGKPFAPAGRGPATFDCVGLVVEVLRRLGRAVPAYLSDHAELHRQLAAGGALAEAGRLGAPAAGRVVLIRSLGSTHDRHVGIMADPYRMLHASRSAGQVTLENLDRSPWGRRVLGFYAVGEAA